MQYIDPFAFFQITEPKALDPEALRRLKRRAMAEFELSNDGFVEFQGMNIDKASVQALLEMLELPSGLEMFWRIRSLNGLRSYLQGLDGAKISAVEKAVFLEDEELRAFCNPMIVPIYARQLGRALESRDWEQAVQLLQRLDLLRVDSIEKAFEPARRFVQSGILQLEAAATEDGIDVLPLVDNGFIQTLNLFPDRFQQLRNAYALALRELAMEFEHSWMHIADALKLINAACDLRQDGHLLRDNLLHKGRIAAKFDAWNGDYKRFENPELQSAGEKEDFAERKKNIDFMRRSDRVVIIAMLVGGLLFFAFLVYKMSIPREVRMFQDNTRDVPGQNTRWDNLASAASPRLESLFTAKSSSARKVKSMHPPSSSLIPFDPA